MTNESLSTLRRGKVRFAAAMVFGLSACELAPDPFRLADRDQAPFKVTQEFSQNYQLLFRCFLDGAPMPFVDGSKRYWTERVYSDLGIAEFQVGGEWRYYTYIRFERVDEARTRVGIWSVYSDGRLLENNRTWGHLGRDYMQFVAACSN